jgi:hypothetical protein
MILSRRLKVNLAATILLLSCFVLSGCHGSGTRAAVEGTVNLDDKPVDGGTITFVPEEYKADGIERTVVTADIKDGKYSVDAAKGAVPGKYRVEIYWKQKTGNQVKDPDTGKMIDETKPVIPEVYNKHTKTTVDIQASGNKFDYKLDSKAVDTTQRRPPTPTRD